MYSIFRSNLGRRILLLVGISILLMLATLLVTGWLAIRQSAEQMAHEREALGQTTVQYLDYVLRQNLARLDGVQFAPGVNIEDSDLEPEKRALHGIYLNSIFDEGVFITDQRGAILWTEPFLQNLVSANIIVYPVVSQALSGGKPAVSNLLSFGPLGKKVILMITPLRNSTGKPVGLVGGIIDPARQGLREFISPVVFGKTTHIDVVDGDGLLLVSSDPEHALTAGQVPNYPEQEIAGPARTMIAPWSVSVKQSTQEAQAPVLEMEWRLVVFGLAALLIAFFFSWGMARSLLKPIGQLTTAARNISHGDLSQPVPQSGNDEIGELAKSLDVMRVALNRSLGEVREGNRQLEAKVEERTRKLEESYREIERKEAARGELLRRVLYVQEEERKRIARELHDETTQSILGLVMRLEAANKATVETPGQVRNLLAEIKTLGNRTLDSVHRIIYDLRPSVLDDLGLLSALRWLAENRLEPMSVKTRVEVTGEERKLPPHIEIALFRVVQEAVSNIARHAEARNVVISVEFKDFLVLIEVEDDGKGFDIRAIGPTSEAKGAGLGLLGMRERVTLLGGKFRIESQPGEGTHLTIEVPLS